MRAALIIEGNASGAKKALDDTARGLDGGRRQAERATRGMPEGFGAINSRIGVVTGSLSRMHGLLATVATGALTVFLKRSIDFGDEIGETAKQLGLATGKLQEYRIGAGLAGVDQEELNGALRFFGKSLGDSGTEVTGFHKALGQLGLRVSDLKSLKFDQSLELVSDRLSKVTNETERNNIAFELFSRTGIRAINWLAAGSGELAKFAEEARRAGFILNDDMLGKAGQADDEFKRLGMAVKVAGVNIAVGFLPAITSVREVFTDPSFQAGVRTIAGGVGDVIKGMLANKNDVIAVAGALSGAFVGARIGGLAGAAVGAIAGGALAAKQAMESTKGEVQKLEEEIDRLVDKSNTWREIMAGRATNLTPLDPAAQFNKAQAELAAANKRLTELHQKLTQEKKAAEGTLSAPLKVTVSPATPIVPHHPEIVEAIKDLRLKRGELEGEFKGIAEGFPDLLKSLNLQGGVDVFSVAAGGAGALSGQLKELHGALAAFQGAQMRLDVATPQERYNRELEKTNALLAAGAISQETLNRKAAQLAFPQLNQLTMEMGDLRGQTDQFATGSLNNLTAGLSRFAMGEEQAADAAYALRGAVLRSLAEMIIKMTITLPIARALQAALGGLGGFFGGVGANVVETIPSGFDQGGYTGNVGRGRIAGVVHGQEFVVKAAATARHLPLLQAINDNKLPGYLDGGMVGAPNVVPFRSGNGGAVLVEPVINFIIKKPDNVEVAVGKPSKDGSGGINIELVIDMVDQGMAQRQADGSGHHARVLKNDFGVSKVF